MKPRSAFTLIELLSVLAVSAVIFSFTGRLFGDGWRETQRIRREAEAAQTVILIMDRWQHALRGTAPAAWSADAAGFVAGPGCRVHQDGRRLVFAHEGGTNRVALPAGMECAFAVNRPDGGADIAVLTLTLQRPGRKTEEHLRLVAGEGLATP